MNNVKIDSRRTTQKSTIKETVNNKNIRLRAENKILKQERDILKKATAYFSREVLNMPPMLIKICLRRIE